MSGDTKVHKSNSFSKYSTTVAFQNMLVTADEDSFTGTNVPDMHF
jgi:hypothetical protein